MNPGYTIEQESFFEANTNRLMSILTQLTAKDNTRQNAGHAHDSAQHERNKYNILDYLHAYRKSENMLQPVYSSHVRYKLAWFFF